MKGVAMGVLNDYEARGLVRSMRHPRLPRVIWNYTPKCAFERAWDPVTMICRGLITNEVGAVVANPFPKFFNVGEVEETKPENLPAEIPVVEEKLDGSLGILYFDRDMPMIATRGSFDSDQAIWASAWLHRRFTDWSVFSPRWTYLFEIIYPENRIVVDYGDRAELVLLAIRDTDTGEEGGVTAEASRLGLVAAKRFTITGLSDLDSLLAVMDGVREEGFVCRFSNGLRAKFKSEDYRRLHRIITGVSAKSIWEALSTVGNLDALTHSAPVDFTAWATGIGTKLTAKHGALVARAASIADKVRVLPSRKEQAFVIVEEAGESSGIAFALLDNQPDRASERAWKMCRPERVELFRKDIDAT